MSIDKDRQTLLIPLAYRPPRCTTLHLPLRYRGLAYTRYCHHQYCIVYGIKRGGGGGAYIAQWSCNSIAKG